VGGDIHKRTFARAAELLGGWDRLAQYLRADPQDVRQWARQAKPVPVSVLQSLAQILKREITRDASRKRH